jgi:hypothetical protein
MPWPVGGITAITSPAGTPSPITAVNLITTPTCDAASSRTTTYFGLTPTTNLTTAFCLVTVFCSNTDISVTENPATTADLTVTTNCTVATDYNAAADCTATPDCVCTTNYNATADCTVTENCTVAGEYTVIRNYSDYTGCSAIVADLIDVRAFTGIDEGLIIITNFTTAAILNDNTNLT